MIFVTKVATECDVDEVKKSKCPLYIKRRCLSKVGSSVLTHKNVSKISTTQSK